MATRERPVDRARRRAEASTAKVCRDIGLGRRAAGLSLVRIGQQCGLSKSQASRLERGLVTHVDLADLFCMADAVGLAISMRAVPEGDAFRDAGHVRMIERFRSRLAPSLKWTTEVPLPIPGDRRSWDAIVAGDVWRLAIEAETVIDDIQALHRRLTLKLRDGRIQHVILLVADTPRNRAAIESARAMFADFPLDTRQVLAALGRGEEPSASGIVFI